MSTSEPQPAHRIAAAVRAGESTAVAEVRAALRRIAERDGTIRAFSAVFEEAALADAGAVDARPDRFALPLAGVPVAVKDIVSPQHPVVRRLRAAGAVVVGATATPQLCAFGTTDSPRGVTRNPWDTRRSSGGSSGGAAAAVAAGMVPLAHGTDGMGSLRIPAAACGLVTLKPGRGVVPAELGANDWFGMAENGVLATTVADVALGTAALAGRDVAPAAAPSPVRVAVSTGSPQRLGPVVLAPVARAWEDAALTAASVLARAGDRVVGDEYPYPPNPLPLLARWTAGVDGDARHEGWGGRDLEPRNRAHAALGRLLRPLAAERHVAGARRRAERFFDRGHDVLLTPTLADFPLAADTWHRRSWIANVWANLRFAPFPSPWNQLGWPAMSVPGGVATAGPAAGLPVGVQLVARPGGEELLLAVAARLEAGAPWRRLAPRD